MHSSHHRHDVQAAQERGTRRWWILGTLHSKSSVPNVFCAQLAGKNPNIHQNILQVIVSLYAVSCLR